MGFEPSKDMTADDVEKWKLRPLTLPKDAPRIVVDVSFSNNDFLVRFDSRPAFVGQRGLGDTEEERNIWKLYDTKYFLKVVDRGLDPNALIERQVRIAEEALVQKA